MQKVGKFLGATMRLFIGVGGVLFGSYLLIQIPSAYKAEVSFRFKATAGPGTVTEVTPKERFVQSTYAATQQHSCMQLCAFRLA